MWRTDEHDARNVCRRGKEERTSQPVTDFRCHGNLIKRFVGNRPPKSFTAVGHLHFADEPAHTVANNDDLRQLRITAIGVNTCNRLLELPAHLACTSQELLPRRILKNPYLKVFDEPANRIEFIDHFDPSKWIGEKSMHENQRDFAPLIGFDHTESIIALISRWIHKIADNIGAMIS